MYRAKQLGGNRYSQCMEDLATPGAGPVPLGVRPPGGAGASGVPAVFPAASRPGIGQGPGVEALLRWQHPEQGLIGPQSFIAVAEDSVSIEPLDAWVLRNASAQLKRWQDAGLPRLHIAVPLLSRRPLAWSGLAPQLEAHLAAAGVPPDRLELEIDEPLLLEEAQAGGRYLVRKAGRPSPDDERYAGARCWMRSGNQGTASASGILRRAPR